jgi:hypothetical protein
MVFQRTQSMTEIVGFSTIFSIYPIWGHYSGIRARIWGHYNGIKAAIQGLKMGMLQRMRSLTTKCLSLIENRFDERDFKSMCSTCCNWTKEGWRMKNVY